MGLIPTNLINSPLKKLDLISARQEALADNVTNMHTPGYRRKDVDFSQYLNNSTSASTLETKMINKFGPAPIASQNGGATKSTEDELALMQQNYMLYSTATKQLKSTITQLKSALNVSSNG